MPLNVMTPSQTTAWTLDLHKGDPLRYSDGTYCTCMSRIERRYCFLDTCIWLGYLSFSYYFIFDKIICVLMDFYQCMMDFYQCMRTLCYAYHEERASHLRSILDISLWWGWKEKKERYIRREMSLNIGIVSLIGLWHIKIRQHFSPEALHDVLK